MSIEYMDSSFEDKDIYKVFNPVITSWWRNKFKEFTPPQKYSIVNIHKYENTLISSPTGSGKTLSAFTAILNELTSLNALNKLEDEVYCIYISPLKALGNDIEKNLNEPLEEIKKLYEEKIKDKKNKLSIRVGVRTGDTSQYEKSKMVKKPPHILITTPESFAIMLTSIKLKEKLQSVKWVIVDEIHSLANNKRGVHLSISLERLSEKVNFCRIGLSATVAPLEEVARYLVGLKGEEEYRECKIVDVSFVKKHDLKVISPVANLIRTDLKDIRKETYGIINDFIQNHKTTLIFTNTRSATERVVHHLKDRFPSKYSKIEEDEEEYQDLIGAHHGSLSYEHRLNVENKLKNGELKAVVSSTSLEMGIDIGSIDLVLLLGSPKSVARALQRIGRAGHRLDETSQGRIIVLDRDDLVECAVLLKASIERKIDKISVPKNVFDVLSQQIYGIVIEQKQRVEDVYNLIRRSYCFKDLTKEDYYDVLKYLAGEYVSLEDRNVYAKIWVDNGEMGKKGRLARVIYMTNVGTIPDETNVRVKLGQKYIGSISEPFLERLRKGDIFVLGGKSYEFRHAQGMTAFVNSNVSRSPTVPSWFSEMLPLSYDLALEIQRFRRFMEEQFEAKLNKKDIISFINEYLYVDEFGANSIYEYFREQYLFSEIPHDKKLVIEHYDDSKNKHYIFHTVYGRRVNDVLSRAVAFVISKMIKRDVEININDNGFYVLVPKTVNIQITNALNHINPDNFYDIMKAALDKTEVLNRRFRHCAARSLMILRNYKGKSKSVSRQQLNSRLLISAIKRIDNNFVILREARREVLEDLMDIKNAKRVLEDIQSEKIKIKETFTKIPSPFAFNLISMGYSDIMKLDDKQAFLKRMHEYVLAKIGMKTNPYD
ncbi:MAG: ATP-dependent helicase [Candidatus Woesearchaeota archaeon]